MPQLIVLAGPNGAGKTSFAERYLQVVPKGLFFVNADIIAAANDDQRVPKAQLDLQAGRKMLAQIDRMVEDRADIMIETTLASLTYARKVLRWREIGYRTVLIYLRLPSVEASIARVRKRAASGGTTFQRQSSVEGLAKALNI
jgi:predicted ABC-type ATPase